MSVQEASGSHLGASLLDDADGELKASPLERIYYYAAHYMPILRWLPMYDVRRNLPRDIVAGFTVGVMAVPQALSYASIAGLQPQFGLYNAFSALFPYFLFGTSAQIITGPTAVMSIIVRGAVPEQWGGKPLSNVENPDTYEQVAFLLAFLAGVLQVVLGVTRLGRLVTLVSHPTIVGFTTAAAFLIGATQFSNLLGVPKCVPPSTTGSGRCNFVESMGWLFTHLGEIQGYVVLASVLCMLVLILFKYILRPRLPRVLQPLGNFGPLLLVLITIPMWTAHGDTYVAVGLEEVGTIPPGLPQPRNIFTNVSFRDIVSLFGAAVLVAAVGFMESMTIATTVARKNGGYSIDPTQELTALGVCNIVASQFQGYPATGSFSRTAVNASSSARSPIASLIAAGVVGVVCAVLTPTLSHLPKVVLAAIIFIAIINLVEFHEAAFFYRANTSDFIIFLVVFCLVLLAGVEIGLVAGIILTWALALTHTHWTHAPTKILGFVPAAAASASTFLLPPSLEPIQTSAVPGMTLVDLADPVFADTLADAAGGSVEVKEEGGGDGGGAGSSGLERSRKRRVVRSDGRVCVIQFDSELTFANADRLRNSVDEAKALFQPTILVLDASRVVGIDASGLLMLRSVASDAKESGMFLVLAGLSDGLPRASSMLRHIAIHRGDYHDPDTDDEDHSTTQPMATGATTSSPPTMINRVVACLTCAPELRSPSTSDLPESERRFVQQAREARGRSIANIAMFHTTSQGIRFAVTWAAYLINNPINTSSDSSSSSSSSPSSSSSSSSRTKSGEYTREERKKWAELGLGEGGIGVPTSPWVRFERKAMAHRRRTTLARDPETSRRPSITAPADATVARMGYLEIVSAAGEEGGEVE